MHLAGFCMNHGSSGTGVYPVWNALLWALGRGPCLPGPPPSPAQGLPALLRWKAATLYSSVVADLVTFALRRVALLRVLRRDGRSACQARQALGA